jgi:hypothetical protein
MNYAQLKIERLLDGEINVEKLASDVIKEARKNYEGDECVLQDAVWKALYRALYETWQDGGEAAGKVFAGSMNANMRSNVVRDINPYASIMQQE